MPLERADAVLTVRQKGQVGPAPKPLSSQRCGQTPTRPDVLALDKAEALGLATAGRGLADDDHEMAVFARPVAQIPTIDPHCAQTLRESTRPPANRLSRRAQIRLTAASNP